MTLNGLLHLNAIMVYIIAISGYTIAHHWSAVNWILHPNAFMVYNIAIMSHIPAPDHWSIVIYHIGIMIMAISGCIHAADYQSAINWIMLHPNAIVVYNIAIMNYILTPYPWSTVTWILHPNAIMVYNIAIMNYIHAPHHWSTVNWIFLPNAFMVYGIAIMSCIPDPDHWSIVIYHIGIMIMAISGCIPAADYQNAVNWMLHPNVIVVNNIAIIMSYILTPYHWSSANWIFDPNAIMTYHIAIMNYFHAPHHWSTINWIFHPNAIMVYNITILGYIHAPCHWSMTICHISFLIITIAFDIHTPYHWSIMISCIIVLILIVTLILYQLLSYLMQYKVVSPVMGGHKTCIIKYKDVSAFTNSNLLHKFSDIETKVFCFIDYVHMSNTNEYYADCYLHVKFPMHKLIQFVSIARARQLAVMHDLDIGPRTSLAQLKLLFKSHIACNICNSHVTIVSVQTCYKEKQHLILNNDDERKQLVQQQTRQRVTKHRSKKNDLDLDICELTSIFPPQPVDKKLSLKIIDACCSKLKPENFEEKGCAVCGQLICIASLSKLSAVKNYLHILEAPGCTRQERYKSSDKICEFPLAIDHSCQQICNSCRASLCSGNIQKLALARGLWLGQVPKVLSGLHYVEKLLVARIRHSFCSIRVASGMRKMKAHAIAYQQAIPKIYNILPPPKADIEEVLAIMFTGPCKPTLKDFQRTPFLVRRNHVKLALEWLILNHADYEDVSISTLNLNEYPEDVPPVSIEYKQIIHNKIPEGTSVHDMEEEDGTTDGQCAFTVHGLTGEELNIMSTNAVKVKSLQHLNSQGKFLAIGHSKEPESIWHNPQLYPQMFPWLFPYGLGGVSTVNGLSDKEHKKWLLMYSKQQNCSNVLQSWSDWCLV
jgi:hypothetical protein